MHLFFSCIPAFLSLFILCANAFKLYGPRHIHSLFQKRSTLPERCVLVRPSLGFSVPATSGGTGDQSPLLPGPSTTRGQPGTIQAQSACGDIGATETISPVSGPNGAISWMTCGLNSTGWTPSYATVSDIITADLSSALDQGNSPFEACNDYLDIIDKYSAQFQASFAMQESGCQPDQQGEGGEQGIMQISEDKCGGAPDGNCKDPDFNIHQGTQFLANTLTANNGNILGGARISSRGMFSTDSLTLETAVTIGQYNGWYKGMTFAEATADANTSCCHCQQNLDYIFQMLNGWVLNRNPLTPPRLGEYFNLDICS